MGGILGTAMAVSIFKVFGHVEAFFPAIKNAVNI